MWSWPLESFWKCQCMRLFVVAGMQEYKLLKLCPLLKRGPGVPVHLHLKGQTQKRRLRQPLQNTYGNQVNQNQVFQRAAKRSEIWWGIKRKHRPVEVRYERKEKNCERKRRALLILTSEKALAFLTNPNMGKAKGLLEGQELMSHRPLPHSQLLKKDIYRFL